MFAAGYFDYLKVFLVRRKLELLYGILVYCVRYLMFLYFTFYFLLEYFSAGRSREKLPRLVFERERER